MKYAYWLSHSQLESKARCFYGDIYELDDSFGSFDVVLLGQIFVHLRDGIDALTSAATVCGNKIIIVEGSFHNEYPIAALSGGQ